MDTGLQGKTALVTGSHRGTGQIIADLLAAEGSNVIYHGLQAEDYEKLQTERPGVLAVCGDITTEAGTAETVNQVMALTGGVDVLVNNYGTADAGKWQTSTTEDWITSYQKNTLSVVRLIQAFTPGMTSRGWGRIVNLGTVGSTKPNARSPQYYAAKGALANLTVGLAKELSGTGITVNLVSPGMIRTAEVEEAYLTRARAQGWGDTFEEAEAQIVRAWAPNPLGRMATREEVAQVVVFLSSQAASFVNA
ncbi:MAG: SDR family oxidoreductase, partial [Pseudomonadales bacterium]|nr:SDR family oxidoreductase [Pseudomonadales bacterium]